MGIVVTEDYRDLGFDEILALEKRDWGGWQLKLLKMVMGDIAGFTVTVQVPASTGLDLDTVRKARMRKAHTVYNALKYVLVAAQDQVRVLDPEFHYRDVLRVGRAGPSLTVWRAINPATLALEPIPPAFALAVANRRFASGAVREYLESKREYVSGLGAAITSEGSEDPSDWSAPVRSDQLSAKELVSV